jgi:HSP20 family molecular chaperone IbpA
VELPGVAPANVSLTLEKNVLTVSGSSTCTPPDGMSPLSGDQGNRTYERAFELSDQIERQQIDAEVKNGLLTIRLPKAQIARKQTLSIRQP